MGPGFLAKKRIVIIGGTAGIGLAAAKAFIEWGAKLSILGLSEIEDPEISSDFFQASEIVIGDARDPEAVTQAVEQCETRWGGFDGLFHVTGGSGRKMGDGPLHELSLEGWNQTLELNLTSAMISNQLAVKKFLKSGNGGTILNTGSVLGYSPSPPYFSTHAYAAAKSALMGFTRSIAAYYAPNNIRINLIAPGLIETPMSQRAIKNREIMDFIKTKQPLDQGRVGKPEDLIGLAGYCMSDYSLFTTGQIFTVDGGWHLSEGQISSL